MYKFTFRVITLALLLIATSQDDLFAQAPLGFNYQGVALTNAGTPVATKKISLRISLIESTQLGNLVYQETHGVNTDAYGQFSVIIGNGQAVNGKMSDVQWNKFPYYLKVELDLDGGTSFVFVGTSQLLSVPYALYANNAGAASISVDSVKNELTTIRLSQKGDSIILSNNRGAVYVPKIDSLSKIVTQLASIKTGTIKSIKDSVSKLPNGIAIGYNALNNFDSTALNSSNIAFGQNAGVSLTKKNNSVSNNDNILIGQNAAASINSSNTNNGAYQNIMIGNGAGQNTNSLASQNIVIGHEAAKNSNGTLGTKTSVFNNNVAIGARTLKSAIASESNVSIGVDNMNASTQVNRNTMIGSNSVNKYNGDDNVIIGAEMLQDSSSNGSKNVIIGSIVAKNIRGSKNVILGYKAAYDSSFFNTNNKLIIANDSTRTPLILGEFDNKKVTINGDLTVTGKLNGSSGSNVSLADSKGNIAVGNSSLVNNKTGYGNIGLGLNTLNLLDSGSNNIAIGANTLTKMVVGGGGQGSQNIALGMNSLMNSTGNGNTALGVQTLQTATTASWNTAVGEHSMAGLISGSSNVSIGYMSMISSSGDASNNVIIGRGSGQSVSSNNNVAIGSQSMVSNTTGSENISIGYTSLYNNKTGSSNVAIGVNAGTLIDSGSNNIFLGNNAGNDSAFVKSNNKLIIANSNTKTPLIYGEFDNKKLTINGDLTVTGKLNGGSSSSVNNFIDTLGNLFIGKSALKSNTTGWSNLAIGENALTRNTTSDRNLAIGQESLSHNTIGGYNLGVGTYTLFSNINGQRNVAVGMNSLISNTSGDNNTSLGFYSLSGNTTGGGNVAIGSNSLYKNKTGVNNIGIGTDVISSDSIGSYNVAIGVNAGGKLLSGDNNIFLGSKAGFNNQFVNSSNKLVIQNDTSLTPLIYGEFDNKKLTINGDLIVGGKIVFKSLDTFGNFALGDSALISNIPSDTTSIGNTAIGWKSLRNNTIGGLNTANGYLSLANNIDGSFNTAIGSNSLFFNTTGSTNTASGDHSLYSNKTGSSNISYGTSALYNNISGSSNSAVGFASLFFNISGSSNTAFGKRSLYRNTSGYSNVANGAASLYNNLNGSNNIGIGDSSLFFSISASGNTAVGSKSLYSNTTGYSNTSLGLRSLSSNSIGFRNTAIGDSSMYSNTTGSYNTGLGGFSLNNNTSGYNNTAMGFNALFNNSTGYNNTAIGLDALHFSTSGTNNIAGGTASLYFNTSGSDNTAYGIFSLYANTSGSRNTAIGIRAASSNTTATNNVAVGYESLNNTTTGIANTAIGYQALKANTIGNQNIALGNYSLGADTSGSSNTAIGSFAGGILQRGDSNIFIGNYAGANKNFINTSNKLVIQNDSSKTPLIYGEFDNKKLTINGDLIVTGKATLQKTDSIISALNKRVDSLYAILTRVPTRIDSSALLQLAPIIANKFLDSTFLPAINLDGKSSYINIGSTNLASALSGSNCTIEFWLKNTKKSTINQTIFSTGYDYSGQGINVNLNSGRLTFSFANFNHQISLDYPDDSLWHHVLYTNKEKTVSIIYLDGIEKMRSNNTGLNIGSSQRLAIGAAVIGTNPQEFLLGSLRKLRINKGVLYNSNFTPSYTYGKIDSTIAFWELNDLGTHIKANDSAYNGTLYNGSWSVLDSSKYVNLNDSLVAYYPFSGNANDSSKNGLNGTVNKAILTSDRFGNLNSAYSFKDSSYINILNSVSYNTYPFSVSLWVSYDSLNMPGGNLFSKYTPAGWNGFSLLTSTGASENSGYIYPYYLTGDVIPNGLIGGYGLPETKFVINNIPTKKWVNVIMTVDQSGGKLYLNGTLIDSLDWRTPAKACDNNLNWKIGGAYQGDVWFKGKIDDLRVYKRPLNSIEIKYLSTH